MLVSHTKKFIYTKTTKTAGTSVESYFEKYCMVESSWEFAHHRDQQVSKEGIIGYRGPHAASKDWFNHMPAIAIRDKIGIRLWEDYFKFCMIRNPFDKLVSWFFFQKERGLINISDGDDLIACFRERLTDGVPVLDRDRYFIEGKLCIDYFIKYEDIESGIKFVCDRLGLPFDPGRIPKLKSGIRDHTIPISEFYSEDLIELVRKAYQFELSEFGYSIA